MKDYGRQNSEYISVGNWILTFILMAIPGVNLIAGLCYLFSKKKSKRNYILAMITIALILIVLSVAAYFIVKLAFPDIYQTAIDFVKSFATDFGVDLPVMLTA